MNSPVSAAFPTVLHDYCAQHNKSTIETDHTGLAMSNPSDSHTVVPIADAHSDDPLTREPSQVPTQAETVPSLSRHGMEVPVCDRTSHTALTYAQANGYQAHRVDPSTRYKDIRFLPPRSTLRSVLDDVQETARYEQAMRSACVGWPDPIREQVISEAMTPTMTRSNPDKILKNLKKI